MTQPTNHTPHAHTRTHTATTPRTTPARQAHQHEAPHSTHTHTKTKEKGTQGPHHHNQWTPARSGGEPRPLPSARSGEGPATAPGGGPQPGVAGPRNQDPQPGVARGQPPPHNGGPQPGVAGRTTQVPQPEVAGDPHHTPTTVTQTPAAKKNPSRRPFRSDVKEQKQTKAKCTFSVNRKPTILFKIEPRTKINCHPVNHTPQPDSRIQQSLEILQNIAKTNLQIVTVISHCFNNHQADSCHFPHVHFSTKDRSHDLPQQVSHTPVSHASPYEHVKPISRHLTPDTLHQPLSPPTPQV